MSDRPTELMEEIRSSEPIDSPPSVESGFLCDLEEYLIDPEKPVPPSARGVGD